MQGRNPADNLESLTTQVSVPVEQSSASPPVASQWPLWSPIAVGLLLSVLVRAFEIDQAVSARFYDPASHSWPLETAEPWYGFYFYGRFPPIAIGVVGGIIAVFGRKLLPKLDAERVKRIRWSGLLLCLWLIIGPGFLVEFAFKTFWGRPRPIQCKQFEGDQDFVPVGNWLPGKFPYTSFPSGHAAIAFFMMAPAFVLGAQRRRQQRIMLAVGLAYGLAMGCTRIAQGGHFLSDVLWAGMIVYVVGVVLKRSLGQITDIDQP